MISDIALKKVKESLDTLSLTPEDKDHIHGEGLERLTANVVSLFSSNPESLLDVGCGDGTIAYCLQKIMNTKVTGLDCDSVFLDRAAQKGIDVIGLDLEKDRFPFPNESFSNATFIEVLEHLSKPEHCLSEIARVLKTNGELILTTPNLADLRGRLSIIKGKDPLRAVICGRAYHRHIRLYAKNSLEELLSNWFIITKVSYCNSRERETWKGLFRDALCYLDNTLSGGILVNCRKK